MVPKALVILNQWNWFFFAKQSNKTFPRYPKIPIYRHKNDKSWKPITNQNNVKRLNKKKKKLMDQNIENHKDQEKRETMSDEQYFSSHVTTKHLALLGFC
jgi:ribosomal protein L15